MANRHNRKPKHINTDDVYTADVPNSEKIVLPAARMQNYLRNWKQQGQLFSYSGNHDFDLNPGFADVKNNSSNDADCEYYMIFHAPPKIDQTDPKRLLGGILIPWRYRTTYTENNRATVSSTPTIQWTAPPYETFSDVVTDGDMETAGYANWLQGNNATRSKETDSPWDGSQNLKVAYNGTNNPYAYQACCTLTKHYIVRGYARSGCVNAEYPSVRIGVEKWDGDVSADWQYFRFEVNSAGSTDLDLYAANATGSGEYCEFDNIEVLEATTVTPSATTIYQKNGESPEYGGYLKIKDTLIDGDMELANTTNWGSDGSSTLSKSATTPQEGTKCLRITAGIGQATGFRYYAYQDNTVTGLTWPTVRQNRRYLFSGYARSDGTECPAVNIIDAGTNLANTIWIGTTSTDWQFFQVEFTAGSFGGVSADKIELSFKLASGPSAGTEYVEFDNLRLLEIGGRGNNRYRGATQLNYDWDMEMSGTSQYTDIRCTSSKDTSEYYKGSQSLKLLATAGVGPRFYTYFSPGLTLTNEYRITGYAKSDGNVIPFVTQDTATSILWIGTNSESWQYFDITFTAVQTYIALQANYNQVGTNYVQTGKEAVWFDNVEIWEVDHSYSGWKLHDKTMKRITLGNGGYSDDFYYVPPSDGDFCVGKLTTKNIQTCALGVWSMPDTDLTLDQKVTAETELLPKTSILGFGPSSYPQDIGSIYNLIGYTSADYDDSAEAMTRRCFFQWGHPRGVYVTSASSTYVLRKIPIYQRNLRGETHPTVAYKKVLTAMVITTTNCSGGAPITITVDAYHPSVVMQRVWTITSNISATLLTDDDNGTGTPLYTRPNTTLDDTIDLYVTTTGSAELLIHTVSFWETSGFEAP